MTEERLPLNELLQKAGDGDFLRAVAESVLQLLMEADVEGLIGAGRHERAADRLNWRNGYRDRPLDTRLGSLNLKIPKLRAGSDFPPFLEARKTTEKALVAVIQEAWIGGVSTRRVDEIAQAMGLSGISKSQVSKLCKEIDERVKAFLERPLEGDWPYLWLDATYLKVREGGRIVSVAAIIAVAANTEGRREIVGLGIGPSEAETFWADFLKRLTRRGLRGVKRASRVMDFVRPFGGECRAPSASLNFSDPLKLSIRLSHDLPTPAVRILGGRATLTATVTLNLTGVEFSKHAPSLINSLPESVKKEFDPTPPPDDPQGEFVTFDAKFVEASYLDPRSHSAVATLGPESGTDTAAIARDFEKATAGLETAAQPSEVYGPDLVEIRLGMSFGEAEGIIRPAHSRRPGVAGDAGLRRRGARRRPQAVPLRRRARDDRPGRRAARRPGKGASGVAAHPHQAGSDAAGGGVRKTEGEVRTASGQHGGPSGMALATRRAMRGRVWRGEVHLVSGVLEH